MKLSELKTGEKAIIVKIGGHGSFRKRLVEMGFISGKKVSVILNAPLKDPIEYEILGYRVSLRRKDAEAIEVVSEEYSRQITEEKYPELHIHKEEEQFCIDRELENIAHDKKKIINIALVGNPNCGKTSLFNIASGAHEHVGNYAGVTVGAKEGSFDYKGYKFILTDLPGTYSLSAYSPEELYVRENLINKTPDIILNVVDSSNLERNLYLSTQLIDMHIPTVIAFNMFDEFKAKGDKIDLDLFKQLLGVEVCPTICKTGEGVNELFDSIIKVYENSDKYFAEHKHINHGKDIEESISKIENLIDDKAEIRKSYSRRYLSIKYLENDSNIEELINQLDNKDDFIKVREQEIKKIQDLYNERLDNAIINAKYSFISGALKETYTPKENTRTKLSISDKIDNIVTNKWLAFPIFIAVLYLIFWATFTIGDYPMGWIENGIGMLSDFASSNMSEGWFKGLMIDGVIAGVGGVLVFLPNIVILYFFLSLMEDSGYMSRAAFIVDKLLHRFGMHGKSFIPMVMGFGCNVPAIMATRTIESWKSRLITMAVIPFMSCGARIPIFVLLAGAFFPKHAALVLLLTYIIGIVIGLISAIIFGKIIKDDSLPFVMELPPYRIPTKKAMFRHTWDKGRQYLEKMATTILIGSMLLWFLGYYPQNQELKIAQENYAELLNTDKTVEITKMKIKLDSLSEYQQENSYIGTLGKALEPSLKPLGINWRMGIGLLTGIIAKEMVVSSLAVMYSKGSELQEDVELSEDKGLQNALSKDIGLAGGVAYILFILLYFPCVATFVALKNETGKWSWAIGICSYTVAVAWIVAWIGFQIASLLI